jgi:hypothetical protein
MELWIAVHHWYPFIKSRWARLTSALYGIQAGNGQGSGIPQRAYGFLLIRKYGTMNLEGIPTLR